MPHKLETLEAQLLRLPGEERARLARTLLLSLDEESDEETERIWAAEAERRFQEIQRGEVTPIPSEEVFREARSRLR